MTPVWKALAACRDRDPRLFIGPDDEPGPDLARREAAAKEVCARCLVLTDCVADAVDLQPRRGVWAGLGEADRETHRRLARKRAAALRSAA